MDPQDDGQQEEFPGAFITLGDMQKDTGIIAEGMSKLGQHSVGVLKQALTVVLNNAQARQLLWVADFPSYDVARKAAAAIDERKMCGVPIDAVLDDIAALCAVNAKLRSSIIDAASQFRFTTTYRKPERQDERAKYLSRSPLD